MHRLFITSFTAAAVLGIGLVVLADPPPSPGSPRPPEAGAGSSRTDAGEGSRTSDGGTPMGVGFAPDPAGLTTRHQWVLELAYRAGDVTLSGVRRVELARPLPTPRNMGRFAVELYVGPELLDRVRFDFPLLGAGEVPTLRKSWNEAPSFTRQLRTSTAVMVPNSDRVTRVVLVNRASGTATALPLPSPADEPSRAPRLGSAHPVPTAADGGRD